MKFAGSSIVASALLLGASAQDLVEDVLHSKRNLNKRFIDSDGNYNICELWQYLHQLHEFLTCQVAFYHINDVHAHLDEFRSSGTDCTNVTLGCYGGYARVKTVIEETRPGHNDSLFLNVGDEFQVGLSVSPHAIVRPNLYS